MQFGDLTYEEIRELSRQPSTVVVIPTGCTEQQGPHLTVDFDTWLVESLCVDASAWAAEHNGVTSLVLPALPFGPTPEHRGFGHGYLDLGQELHERVVEAILVSLSEQGFQRMLIWRGCGQHELSRPLARFNQAHSGRAQASQPGLPYAAIWAAVGDRSVPGGHADSFATSLALFRRPTHVRQDQIREPRSRPVDWDDPDLDFAQYSDTGVIGDPTHASAELGAALWGEIVVRIAAEIRAAAER